MNWTNKKPPPAPPVYRPQPVPKVLQRKTMPGQKPLAAQAPRRPVAPPVYRPQAKPAVAQQKIAAPPVYRPQSAAQRYTTPDIQELGGSGKLTENENYFIPDSYGGKLVYAATTASAPSSSDKYQGKVAARSRSYQGYKSKKFLKDCLHTAEEINAGKELKSGGVQSKVSGTTSAFGDSDSENIKLATAHALNDAAAPNVGQAYVIVNQKWSGGAGCPYHAAAVVASDGNDRVTLEVFAGTTDAKRRSTVGTYSMYTTGGGSGDKFHTYWKDNFFKADVATVVIESK